MQGARLFLEGAIILGRGASKQDGRTSRCQPLAERSPSFHLLHLIGLADAHVNDEQTAMQYCPRLGGRLSAPESKRWC